MTGKPTPLIQDKIFTYLNNSNQSKISLCDVLQDVLGLSKSAVYKRIRGEKELGLGDLIKICDHFHISLDQFMLPNYAHIGFGSDALRKKPGNYLDYVLNVRKHLDLIRDNKHVEFTYMANDLPFFHYFHFPILAQFKLFVWNNTVWKFGANHNRFNPYDFEQDTALNRNLADILDMYCSHGGTEIWSDQLFDATIRQIKYYLSTASFIRPEIALEVFGAFKKLKNLLERIAEKGQKMQFNRNARLEESGGTGNIYYNNLHTFNNSIQIHAPHFVITYLSMDTPNFLRCADPAFNKYTSNWVNIIKSKSVLISREGELDRKRYFKIIDAKFEKAEKEIELLIQGF